MTHRALPGGRRSAVSGIFLSTAVWWKPWSYICNQRTILRRETKACEIATRQLLWLRNHFDIFCYVKYPELVTPYLLQFFTHHAITLRFRCCARCRRRLPPHRPPRPRPAVRLHRRLRPLPATMPVPGAAGSRGELTDLTGANSSGSKSFTSRWPPLRSV